MIIATPGSDVDQAVLSLHLVATTWEVLVDQLDHPVADTAITTFTDLLEQRSRNDSPNGYTYLRNGTTPIARLGFNELAARARNIAAVVSKIAPVGARALLLFPSDLSFLPAFFGCLYAGIVAVPVPLPDLSRSKRVFPVCARLPRTRVRFWR